MRIRGCIFDVDGTLLDSMPTWEHLGSAYVRSQGLEPECDLDERFFSMSTEESASYLHEHYFPQLSVQQIKAGFLELIDQAYAEEIPVKPGARKLLVRLHGLGVPLVAATTGDLAQDEKAFSRLGMSGLFKRVLGCDELGTTKREPLIYQRAAELMGTSAQNTVVFEDTLVPATTAHDAGFVVVGVADEASAGDRVAMRQMCDLFVDDLTDTDALLSWMGLK